MFRLFKEKEYIYFFSYFYGKNLDALNHPSGFGNSSYSINKKLDLTELKSIEKDIADRNNLEGVVILNIQEFKA